uniref:G-protein coupled receptors family 1 profile domain-containing protein n=1 Tax=Rhinopithecus bieti TaxID=61621 RepID=A0A2K6LJL2_RHIBE
MFLLHTSEVEVSTFLLIGIPGLEHAHIWISIPICLMYLMAILGNCTILFVIRREHSLQEPRYYFPSMLEFFIHEFTDMESSVLLIMSFDCFIAICNPLRYSSILTSVRVLQIELVILLVLPLPFTLKRLRYCNKHLLSHPYCLHQDVMKLACSDNRVNFNYGLFVALCMMSDSVFIAISYVFILKTVLGIASHGDAINTCVSHICALLIFYVPIITLATMHRFSKHKSPLATILRADAFLLVPPLMNPIVYYVKTWQIRVKVLEKLALKPKWWGKGGNSIFFTIHFLRRRKVFHSNRKWFYLLHSFTIRCIN